MGFFLHVARFKMFLTSHNFSSLSPFRSGTVISVLEKLLSQSTEQDHPGRLVIEAAHGSAVKVRELVQKYPDKVSRSTVRMLRHLSHGLRELKHGKNLLFYLLLFFYCLSVGNL